MKKNKKEKKISFTTKRKDINDKFFDLVEQRITTERYKKKGNRVWKFRKKGVTALAKELTISPATLARYIKQGFVRDTGGMLFTRIEKNHTKEKLSKTHEVTKQYTVHNFTRDNFFKKPKVKKRKKGEMYFFTAGLYIQFSVKGYYKKKGIIKNKQNLTAYTIQNFPITHYSENFSRGYDEFFEIIKEELDSHPSLNFFIFNYFDVKIIDITK